MVNTSSNHENQSLEEQLDYSNQQNKELSEQVKVLTEQVRHLTKLLYGAKTEKSKYNAPDGQTSLFDEDSTFTDSEQTEEQSQQTISYTVVRKVQKKRNDSLRADVEVEVIHHHPKNTNCTCCNRQMVEIGGTWCVKKQPLFLRK